MNDTPITEEQSKNRWRIRRRFAVVAFAELVTMPFWAGPIIENWKTPDELLFTIVWALVAIIGAYIGGVVVDDNWKR